MNATSRSIRHARILLADRSWLVGDVLVRDERIIEIAAEITTIEVTREIDATGLLLLPGVIAPPVHFREPGLESHRLSRLHDRQWACSVRSE
jgi:dihydroorotase